MRRRQFIRFCAATAAASGTPYVCAGAQPRYYARARLIDERGAPISARTLPAHRNLIFHYPYITTPCFLLNLGRPAKPSARLLTTERQEYLWSGGVGPQGSIVAYSAICAHQMAYPTRDISFISYRTERSARNRLGNVIHCCAEHSQYDPAEGARVVAGPAPQPLAAILLEHDAARDALFAVGTLGGEMFRQFFAKYEFRLSLEHGSEAGKAASETCVVHDLASYCRQQVRC